MRIEHYIQKSLELHLFFGRIMKEHAFFLKAGFTPVEEKCAKEAEFYKDEFEQLLCQAVLLSNGLVSPQVLRSEELITEFTDTAEWQTEKLTGISINHDITAKQMRMGQGWRQCGNREQRYGQVQQLNQKALQLLDGLIALKEKILSQVLCCEMFTMNYPLLIEHILREAKLYRQYVGQLERDGELSDESMKEVECFWNQIMMEHAMFIRGLLDPSENELFDSAHGFAKEYEELLERCCHAQKRMMNVDSLEETIRFRDFKATGAQGIARCQIRSVILPLLADHVLREANHYIRLLKS